MMTNRRSILRMAGMGILIGSGIHSAHADLSKEAEQKMINAIPGKEGQKIRSAQFIGYHVTSQPPSSITYKLLQKMWNIVYVRSNKRLRMEVLPRSAGLPGADTEEVLATASGRFDAITVAGPAIDSIMPEVIPIQALAFTFSNSIEAKAVVNTPLYAKCMKEAASKNNFYCLDGLLNAGMRQMTTIKGYPLKNSANLKNLILRIPPGPIYAEQMIPLGIKPIMTSINDALDMMEKGTCMGQENPNSYSVLFGFYRICKYLNKTNHFWSGFNTLINSDTWGKWPIDIQKIVKEEYEKILDAQWPLIEKENIRAEEFCIKNGMIAINTDTQGARESLRDVQMKIIERTDPRLQALAKSMIGVSS